MFGNKANLHFNTITRMWETWLEWGSESTTVIVADFYEGAKAHLRNQLDVQGWREGEYIICIDQRTLDEIQA